MGSGRDRRTQRKLRDPLFTTLAVLVPVRPGPGAPPGTVDLLAVTRDIFSLRMNSNYELQDGRFTFLTLSLSENNFLGRRKLLALVFQMDQATFTLGPLYIDKNLLGRRHELRLRGGPIFRRDDVSLEGSESALSVGRPLQRSLDSAWSWSLAASHRYAVERSFVGADLRTYDAPSTPEDDRLPYEYQQRRWSVAGGVTRAFGDGVEHRLKLVYSLTSQRRGAVELPGRGRGPRRLRRAAVLPRSERAGVLSGAYEIFTRATASTRTSSASTSPRTPAWGRGPRSPWAPACASSRSDADFGVAAIEGGWTIPWAGDGQATAGGGLSVRVQDGAAIDRIASVSGRVVSPDLAVGRVVAELRLSGIFRDEANRYLVLGGDNGLRGTWSAACSGDRRAVLQAELRDPLGQALPQQPVGRARLLRRRRRADRRNRDLALFQNVGIGLRAGPQLSPKSSASTSPSHWLHRARRRARPVAARFRPTPPGVRADSGSGAGSGSRSSVQVRVRVHQLGFGFRPGSGRSRFGCGSGFGSGGLGLGARGVASAVPAGPGFGLRAGSGSGSGSGSGFGPGLTRHIAASFRSGARQPQVQASGPLGFAASFAARFGFGLGPGPGPSGSGSGSVAGSGRVRVPGSARVSGVASKARAGFGLGFGLRGSAGPRFWFWARVRARVRVRVLARQVRAQVRGRVRARARVRFVSGSGSASRTQAGSGVQAGIGFARGSGSRPADPGSGSGSGSGSGCG
ncbi:MAG: hypothetical protein HS111_27630 [Kofleriaceae bacterium]|nr:hypothetical protein [Kofleriaceae bacterium]